MTQDEGLSDYRITGATGAFGSETEVVQSAATVISTVTVQHSRIFLQKEALSLAFQPRDILHRENEMEQERGILNDIFRHTRPQHIMCFGDYGTGKTVLNKHLLEQLATEARQVGVRLGTTYVKCGSNFDTSLKVIRKLLSSVGSRQSTAGFSSVDYVNALEKECENFDFWIVILDEVDWLVRKRNSETKESEADALFNFISRDMPKISVIMITDSWTTISQLQANLTGATADTFRYELITFLDYTAPQLGDILRSRLKIAVKPDTYDEDLIAYVAHLSMSKGKRARGLIQLAQRAAKIAESQHQTKITLRNVETAEKQLEGEGPLSAISALLPPQLEIVRFLFECHGKTDGITFNKWYGEKLAPTLGLGQGRITRFRTLQPLIGMGIVKPEVMSRGRKGVVVKYSLAEDVYTQRIADALNEIPAKL
jgi:cell division control protein 6